MAHVFSMSCKVTAVNGALATAAGRARAAAWWQENGFGKLWLETCRHGERVPTELLVETRDAFRALGFTVCGMMTPTMLNDPAPGEAEPPMVVCWGDPVARGRMARGGRARLRPRQVDGLSHAKFAKVRPRLASHVSRPMWHGVR